MFKASHFSNLSQLLENCKNDESLYGSARSLLDDLSEYYHKHRTGRDKEITEEKYLPFGFQGRIDNAIALLSCPKDYPKKHKPVIDFDKMIDDINYILEIGNKHEQ